MTERSLSVYDASATTLANVTPALPNSHYKTRYRFEAAWMLLRSAVGEVDDGEFTDEVM